MDLARRRRMDEDTVPFKKSIAGNDLFDRAVEDADPALASLLADTLGFFGGSPEELTMEQLAEVLPELERRMRSVLSEEAARHTIRKLQRLVLGWG
jgi:hypothetical protein